MPPWIFHRYYEHKEYPISENQDSPDSPEVKAIKERYFKKSRKYSDLTCLAAISPFFSVLFALVVGFCSPLILPKSPYETYTDPSGHYSRRVREGVSKLEVKTYEEKRDRLVCIGATGALAIFAGGVLGGIITGDILEDKAKKKRDEELEALKKIVKE